MVDHIAKFEGNVVKGEGIAGRDFDVPTANIDCQKTPGIDHGVFACVAEVKGWRFNAALSYGGDPEKFEVHLLNFEGELIGEYMHVTVLRKISEFLPWESKERLRQKILHDLELIREYFVELEGKKLE